MQDDIAEAIKLLESTDGKPVGKTLDIVEKTVLLLVKTLKNSEGSGDPDDHP